MSNNTTLQRTPDRRKSIFAIATAAAWLAIVVELTLALALLAMAISHTDTVAALKGGA